MQLDFIEAGKSYFAKLRFGWKPSSSSPFALTQMLRDALGWTDEWLSWEKGIFLGLLPNGQWLSQVAPGHSVRCLWAFVLGHLTPDKHCHLHFLLQIFHGFFTHVLQLPQQLPVLTASSRASSALISLWEAKSQLCFEVHIWNTSNPAHYNLEDSSSHILLREYWNT